MKNRLTTTATITFHASHNYGSVLQAYALQRTLLALGVDNEIINFRSELQKSYYEHPDRHFHKFNEGFIVGMKRLITAIVERRYIKDLITKYERFEKFINNRLILTEEIAVMDDPAKNKLVYDYYIAGSDQCWNTHCGDFDWSYYLTFTDSKNKISYASSFGPHEPDEHKERIIEEIGKFKSVSARESSGADFISRHTRMKCEVLPDPTLLLSESEWSELAGSEPIIKGEYIFVYSPASRPGMMEFASYLSEKLNQPVVVSNQLDVRYRIKHIFDRKIRMKVDSGPIEFLNLIRNASCVICGSYHAVVFSLIFKVPFYAIGGGWDRRMNTLLNKVGCIDRAVDENSRAAFEAATATARELPDMAGVMKAARERAVRYLRQALDIEKEPSPENTYS